jgi:YesN/AraC family two-component response regulator
LAGNGREGWELAQSHLPDVILSDIIMNEIDGIQLCRLLKSHELTSYIPVILLTARNNETQQLEGFETGADDYFTKPFNLNLLRIRLRNLLESRRRLRARFSREVRVMPQDIIVTSSDEQFLKRAMEIVELNLAEPNLDVQMLSHQLGLSRSQLFRKIKAMTALTPIEFIQNIRLKRAAQLLEKSRLTITEICYEVGFNYPSHFTKSFQDEFGISPKEYRKNHRSLPD